MYHANSKIGFSSRYYEPFKILKAKVASKNIFKLVYNEDKNTYSFPYLYENYKNELEPISISNKIIKSIKQYLDDNLFTREEKKLLLTELLPYVVIFGNDTINTLNKRIDLIRKYEEDLQMIFEYEKTIESLKQINNIINNELISFFTSITSENHFQINNQLIKKNMKSEDDIEEIILEEFIKTNSSVNHIIMMSHFIIFVIPNLNPKEQNLFQDAANNLITNGFITYESSIPGPECFRLTQKGYDKIYTNNSLATSLIQKKKLPNSDFPDSIYKDVLKTLSDYGKDLEKKPKIFIGQDEEGLRDHFLTNLTGRYEKTTATGETFNKKGKTDILVKDDKGNNIFIAECKWWKGAGIFHSTINQLFDNYITWRDTKVAIIFFVENKDFTSVLEQINQEAAKHAYFVEYISTTDNSNFSFIFRQKDDLKNKVQVEIMFFHFPS
ncbi:hypothetical protein Q1W71_23775 [Flavobacterium pectinovorum]|uniref:hypothetical protein n=1 Tax=Flavobacterium pectinovorum TaxID=29533 RepID=UPI00265D775B|nr:hypothetical protein [Flavobacterium pectinovorum]WKL47954.1 hypothetical protein Q1W71_23775 [Flavobacterium pectinovorum]